MREARIILPLHDNDGHALESLHTDLQFTLAKTFGGWTAQPVRGGWIGDDGQMYDDDNLAYDIATISGFAVREIAIDYGKRANQHAVYYRAPDGTVEIINLDSITLDQAA